MNWLTERLEGGPVLGDGAMGTMLLRAGLPPGASSETWNIENPTAVESVHRQYVESGAMYLTTNSFSGTPLALARHGLDSRAVEFNAAAVLIARRAAGQGVGVLGDVGPFGGFLEPYGEVSVGQLEDSLQVQIGALHEAGADGVSVETMVDPVELGTAVRVARSFGDWPVLATYAFQKAGDEFRTIMGTTVRDAVAAAVRAGADVVGANCGTGLNLSDYLDLSAALVAAAQGKTVLVRPNAGSPSGTGGSVSYAGSPKELAEWSMKVVAARVRIVGGCCGTTPEHIKAMAQALGV